MASWIGLYWVGQVFYKIIPVAQPVEGFPSGDGIGFRRVVYDILRFLKIEIPAPQTVGIKIQSQDNITIVSEYGSQVCGERICSANTVFVEVHFLVLNIFEYDGFIPVIHQRTLVGSIIDGPR